MDRQKSGKGRGFTLRGFGTDLEAAVCRLRYEGKRHRVGNVAVCKRVLKGVSMEIKRHLEWEKKTLFPFLERSAPRLAPLVFLLKAEGTEFRVLLRDLSASLRLPGVEGRAHKLYDMAVYLACLLKSHTRQEELCVNGTRRRFTEGGNGRATR